jgi:hypothetical protein
MLTDPNADTDTYTDPNADADTYTDPNADAGIGADAFHHYNIQSFVMSLKINFEHLRKCQFYDENKLRNIFRFYFFPK